MSGARLSPTWDATVNQAKVDAMTTVPAKHELHGLLSQYGQAHLLRFWDELDDAGRGELASQLAAIDWAWLDGWVRENVLGAAGAAPPEDVKPAPYYPLRPETPEQEALYEKARRRGAELLRQGRIAGFTVAGGQGTRLGYDAPKGMFPISPVRRKPLFQLFAESIARAQEKYGATIPWYVMTSPLNDAATREFLEENDRFGLAAADVRCFPQGTFPAVGLDGKVLLGAKGSLALSPNGHGGCLLAMRDSGALADMAARGVRHVSYWQVDNPLVRKFDPLFLGLHDVLDSEMSNRSLTKTGPFEKLGNYCIVNGKTTIIEYSDPRMADLAEQVDEQGRLRFRAGSPAIHILRREFVERLTEGGLRLPVHRADKKAPCVGEDGRPVDPASPNAVKLETFIFDALPLASRVLILEGDREEQFAPVKNPTGVDSVESCRELMAARAARWLENAGVTVPRRADGSPACTIELSPRRFLDPEDVAAAASGLRPPRAGKEEYYQ